MGGLMQKGLGVDGDIRSARMRRDLHMKYVSIADANPAPRLASES